MSGFQKLLVRSLGEGVVQLGRNTFLSLTTVGLGVLILLLLNFVFSIQFFATDSLESLEQRADFSIPLRESPDMFELEALQNQLEQYAVEWQILSAEERDGVTLPQRFHIRFQDLTQVEPVLSVFRSARYTEVVGTWDREGEREFITVIENLLRLRKTVESAARVLVILFIAGGVLLMINTFRIALFSRRQEIAIARLVGAGRGFIAGPFLVEGIFLGLISALVAMILFVLALREITVLPGGPIFLYLWNHIFVWELVLSAVVGALGAWISVQKYLRGKLATS